MAYRPPLVTMNELEQKIDELVRNRMRMSQTLAKYESDISTLKDRAAEQNAEASARIARSIEDLDKALAALRSIRKAPP